MSENTSFAFIMNLLDVNCNLPFQITEGCYLKTANFNQINKIKRYLSNANYLSHFFKYNIFPYEFMYIRDVSEPNSVKVHSQRLEPDKWRYYVLEFDNKDQDKIHDLSKVANLIEVELEFCLQFMYFKELDDFGVITNTTYSFNFFHKMDSDLRLTQTLDQEVLNGLSSTYDLFQQLDKAKYSDIQQGIDMLDDLKHLSYNSKFKVIGLFTIIEFLITHKPVDTGDSITRQVSNKMNLLSKRFTKKLDYSQFFKEASENTIWKKLYTYRSNIAHGGQPDFTKELSILKDELNAQNFLREVVKALLQHSLIEPQLYLDIREC